MRDWVKMRTDLYRDPKVVLIADRLNESVLGWSLAQNDAGSNVTHNVTRCVTRCVMRNATVGALVTVWGVMRHAGKRIGDDLVVPKANLAVIDDIADMPGLGESMAFVGWAKANADGVVFPSFFAENNVDPSEDRNVKNAERQKRWRKKQREKRDVTRDVTDNVTSNPREEKSREENEYIDAIASCADAAAQRSAQQPSPAVPGKRKPRPPKQLCQESEAVAEFPVVGGGVWWLPGWKADEWREVFTGVDVPSEVNKALQWLRDNPSKRKTHGGMLRFLNQWIERAQNDAGRRQAGRGQGDWQNHEQRRENSNAAAIAAVRAKYQSHQQHARIDGDSDGGRAAGRGSAGALFE